MVTVPLKIEDFGQYMRLEVEADDLGRMFAGMDAGNQIAFFYAALTAMAKHPMQWDYIAIELEKPENAGLLLALKNVVLGVKDAMEGLGE